MYKDVKMREVDGIQEKLDTNNMSYDAMVKATADSMRSASDMQAKNAALLGTLSAAEARNAELVKDTEGASVRRMELETSPLREQIAELTKELQNAKEVSLCE